MTSTPPFRRPTPLTPLSRDDVFAPGQVFPAMELERRILSTFWRDCCHPPTFSRAPAPVVELADEPLPPGAPFRRLRAWWLLNDCIIEDAEGPDSERLRLFFGGIGRTGMLWPRYEFRIQAEPHLVEMSFHREPLAGKGCRTRLAQEPDGRIRISHHEAWWGR